ncbi:agmatine deiminase family protein [Adlercreutzia caecimuris]|uniref:agmatine deiminase family protein n=1 Tax=Adlercreutzia caecimuris TaxID=671266 RepID=UPI003CFDE19B
MLPLFGDEAHDRQAAEVLGEAYPDREIVGVACHEMFLGGGNIHCAAQQQPAVG